MSIEIETLKGPEAEGVLDAVSQLRITVFRDWPYLYDGNADYERDYLAAFAQAADAVVVVARDTSLAGTGAIVGAATAAPLMSHTPEFGALFEAKKIDPHRVFYCGESVLLSAYRGRGIGHAFFDHREAAARDARNAHGETYTTSAFCEVVRDPDDPRRPPSYRPLHGFWIKRGYMVKPYLMGDYDWKEPDSIGEISHTMQFWLRDL